MRRLLAVWVVLGSGMAFLVLSALVHTHVTDGIDTWAYGRFYPGQRWGPIQRVADVVVNLLQPAVTSVAVAAMAIRRRSRVALAAALLRIGFVVLVVVFLKWFFQRPDVHGTVAGLGGSYPSGHELALVAYGAPWWLALVLGVALLVTGTHWLTDVVAGVLVGIVIRVGCPAVARRVAAIRTARRARADYEAAVDRS
jgi:membrane-associated phospholipid phosphatase